MIKKYVSNNSHVQKRGKCCTGSPLDEKKISVSVFFLTETWFMLSRNIKTQSNRQQPLKNHHAICEFCLHEVKFVVRHAFCAVIVQKVMELMVYKEK
jgi:hypothetical protein